MTTVDHLLDTLRKQVGARAADLEKQFGISRPTLTRLIAKAGERVCRMGRGPATRYALTREVHHLGTQVPVHRIDEAGRIHRNATLHLLTSFSGNHHWLEPTEGQGTFFEGLPPFAADMSPQGYIGRGFTRRNPGLELPPRVIDWHDDHRLVALSLRGEDCVGAFIIGKESLDRFLSLHEQEVDESDYPGLATASGKEQTGSSAGGEQPKFFTYSRGRHHIVKFASNDDSAAARRWRELLVCEERALASVGAVGIDVATSRWFDKEGYRFLEVERFDRIGARGRRGLLSLGAITDEYFGDRDNWTQAALRMAKAQSITPEDARRIRWLDTFGQLIGNTDRHFGNLSFFDEGPTRFRLAPVYDMLPMLFAPNGTLIVEHEFKPRPPTADTLDVWHDAARHALAYWARLAHEPALGPDFRERCARCGDTLQALVRQVPS
ncbi:type II toxin-antitoxin system HipA family toxin YjjJ [Myxococcus sp. K15C18031901]|uniref:type II toxin-antitoxin system HipA family toxin YjjJ n=1 Tax=Myxococcus dinghuensis TaxID=2906761 RepID=UPI0020A7E2D2|nr:type II toxin-antitoxin system HipA family toxin YjjJ [Myxococcus dinghuensis]MCP3099846.1 type II toxin-antitoxin system HipA family toxin YjjJ [Myxococcus dinghuensis]